MGTVNCKAADAPQFCKGNSRFQDAESGDHEVSPCDADLDMPPMEHVYIPVNTDDPSTPLPLDGQEDQDFVVQVPAPSEEVAASTPPAALLVASDDNHLLAPLLAATVQPTLDAHKAQAEAVGEGSLPTPTVVGGNTESVAAQPLAKKAAKARPKKKVQPSQKPQGSAASDAGSVASTTASTTTSTLSAAGSAYAARKKQLEESKRKLQLEDAARGCPADKKESDFDREMKEAKARVQERQVKREKASKKEQKELKKNSAGQPVDYMAAAGMYNSIVSAGERDVKKGMFITFYREQYARIGKLDTSAYGKEEEETPGLSIKGGHRPMPRPKGEIDLPDDFKQPLLSISAEELEKYNYLSKRMLICIHGDLFDVSDRPDKYGPDGPYWGMVGHDISWGLVCGNDDASNNDHYYDIFKISPPDLAERKLQGLMSWWCFYEKEYGAPVGRLKVYDEEWKLPEPPEIGDVCSIM